VNTPSSWVAALPSINGSNANTKAYKLEHNGVEGSEGATFVGGDPTPAPQYMHIVVTYNSSTDETNAYFNAVSPGSLTVGASPTGTPVPRISWNHNTAGITDGGDEFSWWNRALSQDDIDFLYNTGSGRAFSEFD